MVPVRVKYRKLVENPEYALLRQMDLPDNGTIARMVYKDCEGLMIAITETYNHNLSSSGRAPAGVIQKEDGRFEVILLQDLLADQGE